MDDGPGLIFTILSFLAALSVLVFVHEWGHFIVARLFGVRVDVFSIGFGKELFGWTDKRGMRWKVSALPLGGYVKFFGDASGASNPGDLGDMTPEERAVSFHHQPVYARAAIVAAGPMINFVFAILIYAALFMSIGKPFTPAEVTAVSPDSPAAEVGLEPGDLIVRVGSQSISDARDLVQEVSLYPGERIRLEVQRGDELLEFTPTLDEVVMEDRFGNSYRRGQLGVALPDQGRQEVHRLGPVAAVGSAVTETVALTRMMLVATGQVIMGVRSVDDLGGPVKIAKFTGEQASLGWIAFISFVALISINLGLINLFPIPMLDGGHLLFYVFEAIKGSPVSARLQEAGFMIGFALIIGLMVFLTWNDLNSL